MEDKTVMLIQPTYHQAVIDTEMGPMMAIATGDALCLLEFLDRKHFDRQVKYLRISAPIIKEKIAIFDAIAQELDLYFSGQLKKFTTPLHFIGTDFQQQVWRALQQIPFGQTQSYLEIANKIGKPRGYRAVANANGANRLAIIVPCHRVINTNGKLGGYAGGLQRKERLLQHEQGFAH